MRIRRPFALPVKGDDWDILQWYGNTEEAYAHRYEWYYDSQGLHPGLDLAGAPGTPVYAAGSGRVVTVDLYRGSLADLPHSICIVHGPEYGIDPETGLVYRTFYGHLMDRLMVIPGHRVEEGQLIAYQGFLERNAPDQQHMHFEVRLGDRRWVNPVPLLDASWISFPREPGRARAGGVFRSRPDGAWQRPDDQPDIHFNGPMEYR